MNQRPLISIIIPHVQGKEIIHACLQSLQATDYPNKEVIIVDNASTDGSLVNIIEDYPDVRIIRNEKNLGYAGGCNSGLEKSSGQYVLFLNDDTTFEPDWLSYLTDACEYDPEIAAAQPKILAHAHPDRFDYAGAAGGLLDIFGYPFARGRIFFSTEKDEGQYDDGGDIFWASGTAMFVRRTVLEEVGAFDPDFFAHMEEIDLCWRIHLRGYRIVAVPGAVVYHRAGSTLRPDSPMKLFLNHRNSLWMILKNYELPTLLWVFPSRLLLEIGTALYALFRLDFVRLRAVFLAVPNVLFRIFTTARKRSQVRALRQLPDTRVFRKMYRGSVAIAYFIRGIRCVRDLNLQPIQKKI